MTRATENTIISNNEMLIWKVINTHFYWCVLSDITCTERDDLLQVGRMGLLRAHRSYDPKRGLFSTYAYTAIRGAVTGYLSAQRIKSQFKTKFIEDLVSGGVKMEAVDTYTSIIERLDSEYISKAVRGCIYNVKHCGPGTKDIFLAYYGIGRPQENLKEIASRLGITISAVGQRIARFTAQLKPHLIKMGLHLEVY